MLRTLRELHAARNHRPVADTIGRLIAVTRAHAGFVLWRGGEQALANVLHISDLARRYELEGGLSFRGFVDTLHDASGRADSPEAPILEEGSNGVRLMTVHKAKGLEFPIVVLADIACKLSLDEASRYLDPERKLCAIRIGGWSPLDLQEHNAEEAKRDEAEGIRLAYVAATRARDVLVVPAVGDGPYDKGWVRPLNRALYPPRAAVAGAGGGARRAALQGQADDHGRRACRRAARRRHGSSRAPTISPIPVRDRPTRSCGGIRCCWKARRMMREACAARISSPRMRGPRTSPPIARGTTTGVSGAASPRKRAASRQS